MDSRSNAALIAPLLAQTLSMSASHAHHPALTICNGMGATLLYALTLPDDEAAGGVIASWKLMLVATCERVHASARKVDA